MNFAKLRAVLVAVSTVVTVLLSFIPQDSQAGMLAMLQSCETGTSATGQIGWIGTYRLINGNTVRLFFKSTCPSSVEM